MDNLNGNNQYCNAMMFEALLNNIEKRKGIKPLPQNLRKNGFNYTLVHRDINRAIYRQQVTEICHYFEVFIIKTKPEGIFRGKIIPAREVFPIDEDFGKTAWTYQTYEKAILKFNSLKP